MKLVGFIDGVEVRFDFYPPNLFKAEIPKKMTGTYIVELHAIDDAGNQTNMTDLIVAIDFQKLSFKVLPENFKCQHNNLWVYKELPLQFSYKELVV